MIWPDRLAALAQPDHRRGIQPRGSPRAAERIYNRRALFLIKAGSGPEFDTLSPRLLNEPLPEGPAKGRVVDLHKTPPDYYKARGPDEKGYPTKSKLAELGLT